MEKRQRAGLFWEDLVAKSSNSQSFVRTFRARCGRFPRRLSADFPSNSPRIFGAQFSMSRAKARRRCVQLQRLFEWIPLEKKFDSRAFQTPKCQRSPVTPDHRPGTWIMVPDHQATVATTPTRASPAASGEHCSADPAFVGQAFSLTGELTSNAARRRTPQSVLYASRSSSD